MKLPDRPDGVSEKSWAEYLDRYDRVLGYYARSIEQQDTYQQQYERDLQLREQQFSYQRRAGRWFVVILLAFAVVIGTGILLESRGKTRSSDLLTPVTPPSAQP